MVIVAAAMLAAKTKRSKSEAAGKRILIATWTSSWLKVKARAGMRCVQMFTVSLWMANIDWTQVQVE